MTTDLTKELAAIQERHPREVIAVHESHGEEAWCPRCQEHWPCDAAREARALQAVVEVHRPNPTQCITGDCAREACEHEDKCPTTEFLICRECASIAEWANAYFGETSISEVKWPCTTIRAIEGAFQARGES